MKLKQHLLATALCALPFAANAADLPVKAPPYRVVQPVPFTWTGFYVGGSAGLIYQNTRLNDFTIDTPGGTIVEPIDEGISGFGGLFGVNVGYNYQMGAIVLGVEADIALSTLDNTSTLIGGSLTTTSKLNSLGTVRGRIGYAFDRALLYATGGFAYGHVENNVDFPHFVAGSVSSSGIQTGWTVGGGLEYAVTNNWTVRAEGLYVDLGTETTDANSVGCRFGFKNTYALGRLGLNYKF